MFESYFHHKTPTQKLVLNSTRNFESYDPYHPYLYRVLSSDGSRYSGRTIKALDLPGISKVEVNLANEKAALEHDQSKIKLDTIDQKLS
jgi:hypothetical protein